jgi:hypothetical protein
MYRIEEAIEPPVYFYRYEDRMYCSFDEYGDSYGSSYLKVELRKYRVRKYTPTGVRLCGLSRFVSTKTHKRFACPTIEEAKISFIARKERQAAIHQGKADQARRAIEQINGKGPFDL